MHETKLIGLVGGLGPAATVHYYNGLNKECARLGVSLRLIINQASVTVVLEAAARGDADGLAEHIAGRLKELEVAGAELLAIGAVTPHMCIGDATARTSVPIIDLVKLVADRIRHLGIRKVALMGTRATVSSKLFGALRREAIDPTEEQIGRVHDLYVKIVGRGVADQTTSDALRAIAEEYAGQTGVEAIVLAGTELSLVPPQAWSGLRVVDCAELHIKELVRSALYRNN